MTEKRFITKDWLIYDSENPQFYINTRKIVDIMNALYEENMALKGEVAHYKLILMSLEEEAKRISEIYQGG